MTRAETSAMLAAGNRLLDIAAEGAGVMDREEWLLVMAALFRGRGAPSWRERAARYGFAHEPETLEAIDRRRCAPGAQP